MKNIDFSHTHITGGFWKTKQDMVKTSTVYAVYKRFKETYRFDALKCNWTEADGEEKKPHIFYDSDVAKWLEGASYILQHEKNSELEAIIDEAVDDIVSNADKNGYFNSHFLTVRPSAKFRQRHEHELYCLGHLIEAAIAYHNATGKDKFLKAMCRYADFVDDLFRVRKAAFFSTPGHPELELALVKLYEHTGCKRYLDLASFFIDTHGTGKETLDKTQTTPAGPMYNMDEIPLRQRKTVDGHSVRAMYLLTGAADVARHTDDKVLADLCIRLFDNCTGKRMYITGGIGSTYIGEAFTVDYHLPPRRAYTETCASIGLAMFARRMQNLELNSKYADIIEKVMYNGVLSGVSLDGKSFFYENPLEIDPDFNNVNVSTEQKERFPITQRREVFDCSCCPPNIVRFIPSIADGIYTVDEDTVYVQQFMESDSEFDGIKITQKTDYPASGKVTLMCDGASKLAIRIPSWCKSFTTNKNYTQKNGYAVLDDCRGEIIIDFDMPCVLMRASNRVHEVSGKVALMRGPIVYCLEGTDNGGDLYGISIDVGTKFTLGECDFLLPSIFADGYIEDDIDDLYAPYTTSVSPKVLKFIPYFAFANRGEDYMSVWLGGVRPAANFVGNRRA